MTLHSRRAETTTYNVVLVAEFIKLLETNQVRRQAHFLRNLF